MTKDEKRIKIAEASGWKVVEYVEQRGGRYRGIFPDIKTVTDSSLLPDYFNDLNDMHEAEELLKSHKHLRDYMNRLEHGHMSITTQITWPACHATAAERAEAFGLTLNLWT